MMRGRVVVFKNSYIEIAIKASRSSISKILGEMHSKNLTMRYANVANGKLTCRIRSGDYPLVVDIAQLFNADICKVKSYGALGSCNKLRANSAFIVGLIFAIAIVAVMGQMVLDVDISCDSDIYLGQVERIVKDSGVRYGAMQSSIDCDELEVNIVKNITDVVMCSVYRDGVAIVVKVTTTPQSPLPEDKSSQIVSGYDAIITRVVVRSGTAIVKADDRVRVGDILIDGYINTNKNDYQTPEEANRVPVVADGDIYAKVYYHKRLFVSDNTILAVRTNNVKVIREYYIRGIRIGKEHNAPFERYERVTRESMISLILPITIKTYHYYEVSEEVLSYEQYRAAMLVKVKSELYSQFPPSAVVLGEWVIDDPANRSVVDYYIEVEQRIDKII